MPFKGTLWQPNFLLVGPYLLLYFLVIPQVRYPAFTRWAFGEPSRSEYSFKIGLIAGQSRQGLGITVAFLSPLDLVSHHGSSTVMKPYNIILCIFYFVFQYMPLILF